MSLVTLNGLPVTAMRLAKPERGVWVASLEVTSDERVEGSATLAQGSLSLIGAMVRPGDPLAGSVRVDVVGGVGGFASKPVQTRNHREAPAREAIAELLAELGERLSPTSSKASLGTVLPFWTRATGRGGAALSEICDAIEATWRVLADGSVWVGTETWPAAPTLEHVELDRDDAAGTVLIAPETIGLWPGVVLEGRRVARVEDSFARNEPLRTTFWVAE